MTTCSVDARGFGCCRASSRNVRLFFLLLLALSAQSRGKPRDLIVVNGVYRNVGPSSCVLPDGTSPADRPPIHCYEPATLIRAYGIDRLHEQGLTGKGQVILLVDPYGSPTSQQDLDKFSDTFGLPRTTIEFVYPNGPYINPLKSQDQILAALETSLDLQWAHALAPDAELVNIVPASDVTEGVGGLPDVVAGIGMAAQKYPHGIVSMSFGVGESTFTQQEVQSYLRGTFHRILERATRSGFTFVAATGDSGSAGLNLDMSSYLPDPDVQYPASDPLVTAVGGSALQAGWLWTPEGTANDYWDCQVKKQSACPKDFFRAIALPGSLIETVWREDWALAASGGGVSKLFPAPIFQSGLGSQVRRHAKSHRMIPDLSLNAAVNGGVEVYTSFTGPNFRGPTWHVFGGTSCSSPEMAALVALAGQAASGMLGQSIGIGFLNEFLYALPPEDFNDIQPRSFGASHQVALDSNALFYHRGALSLLGPARVPPVPVSGEPVTPGYDLATGIGSPRAEKFVWDLARVKVESLLAHAGKSSKRRAGSSS